MKNMQISQNDCSLDVLVIDDTIFINKHGLNAEIVIGMDEEGCSQIVAIVILLELSIRGFYSFFKDIHEDEHQPFYI